MYCIAALAKNMEHIKLYYIPLCVHNLINIIGPSNFIRKNFVFALTKKHPKVFVRLLGSAPKEGRKNLEHRFSDHELRIILIANEF